MLAHHMYSESLIYSCRISPNMFWFPGGRIVTKMFYLKNGTMVLRLSTSLIRITLNKKPGDKKPEQNDVPQCREYRDASFSQLKR